MGDLRQLDVEYEEEAGVIVLEIDEGSGGMLPYYDGSYSVIPRKIEQTLETKNKSMRDDVTIDPINYSETSNPQGGNTVVIGYE